MHADPASSAHLAPALVLLSEALIALREASSDEPAPTREAILMRIAVMEKQYEDEKPGIRARAIRTQLNLSRTTYYELRSEAIAMGLIASPDESGRPDSKHVPMPCHD